MSFTIVKASPEHLPALPAIELAAAALFPAEDITEEMRTMTCCPDLVADAQRNGRLFVALVDDAPVGSALTLRVGEVLHLEELGVHPDQGRKGIGRALVAKVIDHAREEGYEAVTLTTFRRLAWNAPFYESVGFRPLADAELTPYLRSRLDEERDEGFDLKKRVAMRYEF